jgi:hypothetical protein
MALLAEQAIPEVESLRCGAFQPTSQPLFMSWDRRRSDAYAVEVRVLTYRLGVRQGSAASSRRGGCAAAPARGVSDVQTREGAP